MMAFWQNGYEKTSVADIVAATGASRYGLYDEFGDKHALYLAALGYYEKNPVAWLLGDLDKDGAGLAELYGYRDRLIAGAATSIACLTPNPFWIRFVVISIQSCEYIATWSEAVTWSWEMWSWKMQRSPRRLRSPPAGCLSLICRPMPPG